MKIDCFQTGQTLGCTMLVSHVNNVQATTSLLCTFTKNCWLEFMLHSNQFVEGVR